jgi:hypothetical protein
MKMPKAKAARIQRLLGTFAFVVLAPDFRLVGQFKTYEMASEIAKELTVAFGDRYRVLNKDFA